MNARKKRIPKSKKARAKVKVVMHEFATNKLHSGSEKGPIVKNPKQAIAIALSESRKGTKSKPKKRSK